MLQDQEANAAGPLPAGSPESERVPSACWSATPRPLLGRPHGTGRLVCAEAWGQWYRGWDSWDPRLTRHGKVARHLKFEWPPPGHSTFCLPERAGEGGFLRPNILHFTSSRELVCAISGAGYVLTVLLTAAFSDGFVRLCQVRFLTLFFFGGGGGNRTCCLAVLKTNRNNTF